MAEYKVLRSFGGNTRGGKVELTAKDAAPLEDAGYVEKIEPKDPKKS